MSLFFDVEQLKASSDQQNSDNNVLEGFRFWIHLYEDLDFIPCV